MHSEWVLDSLSLNLTIWQWWYFIFVLTFTFWMLMNTNTFVTNPILIQWRWCWFNDDVIQDHYDGFYLPDNINATYDQRTKRTQQTQTTLDDENWMHMKQGNEQSMVYLNIPPPVYAFDDGIAKGVHTKTMCIVYIWIYILQVLNKHWLGLI